MRLGTSQDSPVPNDRTNVQTWFSQMLILFIPIHKFAIFRIESIN